MRILVVDDEEPVLRACVRALRAIPGAEIVQQKLSSRAAELLASQCFDLLVSDVRMPEMSGVELIRIAYECDPTLPVILITGFPTPEMVANKSKFGVRAYLMKPIVPDELLATVRRVLDAVPSKES